MMTPLYPSKINTSSHKLSKNRNNIRSIFLQNSPSPQPTLKSSQISYPDLPSDPKKWSSSHVASYLTYCLRIYPPEIISDLSRYVEDDATLTGRKFLRLKEEQLKQMNFNEKWIELIMIGVKSLRREHLKGKILSNGGDIISVEPDEMKIAEESSEESSEEQQSTLTSTGSSSFSDLKDFLIPTSFSNLTSDDKEFISQEFNKLKLFLKSDNENNKDFNQLNRIIEKVISNIETNQEENHGNDKIDEVNKETPKTKSWFFSLFLFNWLNNYEWTVFENGFVQGFMIGGIAVWAFMRYSKW